MRQAAVKNPEQPKPNDNRTKSVFIEPPETSISEDIQALDDAASVARNYCAQRGMCDCMTLDEEISTASVRCRMRARTGEIVDDKFADELRDDR